MSATTISTTLAGAIASLAVAGVVAAASGLIEVARVDERVANHTDRINAAESGLSQNTVRQMQMQTDLEMVKEKVENIDDKLRTTDNKLDLILERLPRSP